MGDTKFKTQKVFNCWDMPEDVKKEFFEAFDYISNDCYIS